MHSNKNILILCNDFPPINSIGAERPYSWYKYFHESGYYPIIITKNWIPNKDSSFQEVNKQKSQESQDIGKIIRVGKKNIPSIWLRNKFQMKFSFLRKGLTLLEKILCFHFGLFDQHYGIYKEARRYIQNNAIDCILTTGEPFVLFRYGYLLKKEFGIKWIADYRDGWYLNHVTSTSKNPIIKLLRLKEFYTEKKIMKNVNSIITVDPVLAEKIQVFLKKQVHVSYNGFWRFYEHRKLLKEKANKNRIVLTHTGTLNNGQRIEVLLEAILNLKKKGLISSTNLQLNLIGLEYYPEQIKRIKKYIQQLDKIIRTTKRLSKEQAILENIKSDYLINFTDPYISGIYGKTYDYIACKKPIVVIPGDNGLLENLIEKNKLGIVLNSKKEIEEFILDPKTNYKLNEKKLSFFTRKNQGRILAKKIDKILLKNG